MSLSLITIIMDMVHIISWNTCILLADSNSIKVTLFIFSRDYVFHLNVILMQRFQEIVSAYTLIFTIFILLIFFPFNLYKYLEIRFKVLTLFLLNLFFYESNIFGLSFYSPSIILYFYLIFYYVNGFFIYIRSLIFALLAYISKLFWNIFLCLFIFICFYIFE